MKPITPPNNYAPVEIGAQIDWNCLEYSKQTGFSLVKNFGSKVKRKNKTHQVFRPIDDRYDEIVSLLRDHGGGFCSTRNMRDGEKAAYILWLAGTKSIFHTFTYWAGRNNGRSLQVPYVIGS